MLTVVLMSVRGRETLAEISVDIFLWYTPTKSFVKESDRAIHVGGRAAASACDKGK